MENPGGVIPQGGRRNRSGRFHYLGGRREDQGGGSLVAGPDGSNHKAQQTETTGDLPHRLSMK